MPRDEISWKTLGGGLETTPKDLTRLGSLLLAGAVLSAANVAYLWTGTGWGYAFGFGIGTESGHRRVAKNGSQRGADSFLLIYPDDGIVIAVMANRQALGGGTAPAEAIAERDREADARAAPLADRAVVVLSEIRRDHRPSRGKDLLPPMEDRALVAALVSGDPRGLDGAYRRLRRPPLRLQPHPARTTARRPPTSSRTRS